MDPDEPSVLRANSIGSVDHRVHKSGSPVSGKPTSTLNPRSCVTCRRRKVKCDKKHPCSNCTRNNVECIFPAPGRAPRKPKKPQDPDLAERLRRLESLVQSLGTQGTTDEDSTPKDSQNVEEDEEEEEEKEEETHDQKIARAKKELRSLMKEKWQEQAKNPPEDGVQDLTNRFGTLIAGEGRSRYISPGLWASLNSAVEDIKDLIAESEEEDVEYGTPNTSESNYNAFIFGLSSANVTMSVLHPPPAQVTLYWQVYAENVDPITKLFHAPQRKKMVCENASRLTSLSRPHECVMFSIYYAAVCASTEADCFIKFGESKTDLLARYKFGLEQALARADFIRTDSIFVLQSFVLYLICVRRYQDARYIWSMSALAVRSAQALGVHRDGSHYDNLTPFKKEMRRRLWWSLCVFDGRASEDLGSDPVVFDMIADSDLPLNLNDSDISMDMKELPSSKIGGTDMTFALVRFEVTTTLRRVSFMPTGKRFGFGAHKLHGKGHHMHPHHHSFEDRKLIIEELMERLNTRYFNHMDESVPLLWLAKTVTQMLISKMYLMVYHAEQRRNGGKPLSEDTRDMLFKQCIDNVECSTMLKNDERFEQYRWLLNTFVQWHALAFILSELCQRTTGPEVERAWKIIDASIQTESDEISKLGSHLWRPLKLLRAKARLEREKALSKEYGVSAITFSGSGQHETIHTAPTGVMGLDLGVSRLYPTNPDTNNQSLPFGMMPIKDETSWQDPTASTDLNLDGTTTMAPVSMGSMDASLLSGIDSQGFSNGAMLNNSSPQGVLPSVEGQDFRDISMIDTDSINWSTWEDMVQQSWNSYL